MIETLPKTITDSFEISETAIVKELGDGLVNTTYLVDDDGERTVLQKMAGMFPPEASYDMMAVTNHLRSRKWIVPTVFTTREGLPFATDDNQSLWRQTAHIDSDGGAPVVTGTSLTEGVASLLGRWHTDMRAFGQDLRFRIPHFHDVEYQANKTKTYLYDGGFQPADFTLASELISMSRKHPALHDDETQIIHADPKLGNILFRDGTPLTLIDFDTVMHGSVWTDCGDFLRSVSGKLVGESIDPATHLEAFATTYAAETGRDASLTYEAVKRATGRIAINLGMRYVCDILDDSYFKWDSAQYETRRDNHLARAEQQLLTAQRVLAA